MQLESPGGETGRRKGLKIPRGKPRAGSSPAPGTTTSAKAEVFFALIYKNRGFRLLVSLAISVEIS